MDVEMETAAEEMKAELDKDWKVYFATLDRMRRVHQATVRYQPFGPYDGETMIGFEEGESPYLPPGSVKPVGRPPIDYQI